MGRQAGSAPPTMIATHLVRTLDVSAASGLVLREGWIVVFVVPGIVPSPRSAAAFAMASNSLARPDRVARRMVASVESKSPDSMKLADGATALSGISSAGWSAKCRMR